MYKFLILERTPKTSRLMRREVVRLVTPGTLLEPLQPDANFLLSVFRGPGSSLGLAWLDLSTGDFHLGLSTLENLEEDLARINPAEVCKGGLQFIQFVVYILLYTIQIFSLLVTFSLSFPPFFLPSLSLSFLFCLHPFPFFLFFPCSPIFFPSFLFASPYPLPSHSFPSHIVPSPFSLCSSPPSLYILPPPFPFPSHFPFFFSPFFHPSPIFPILSFVHPFPSLPLSFPGLPSIPSLFFASFLLFFLLPSLC